MLGDKILTGDSSRKQGLDVVIGGDDISPIDKSVGKTESPMSLSERIAVSTEKGGLMELPGDFDDEHGDWQIINSENPFETLYLDYRQYRFINKEIVKQNYSLLERFWKSKFEIMNTGGNRVAFKSKYGDGVVEKSLGKCKKAYDKLTSSDTAIETYFNEINTARIQRGSERLKDYIEQMLLDGSADNSEIIFCFETGERFELNREEVADIIQRRLDVDGFKPYGEVSGATSSEKLLSVESWMTPIKLAAAEALKKERESLKVQILPGKYASTIEEIGSILFGDPEGAKKIIKEDVLKPLLAQKDIVLAIEVGNIAKENADITGAFFQVVYKLNHTLPFPLFEDQNAKDIHELTSLIFENEQSLKKGKDALKKGYIEDWLKETDKLSHEKLVSIRDTSDNLNLAFLSMLYTFNPTLPYRFASDIFVNDPTELVREITRSSNSWKSGKNQLYDGSVITWLGKTGKDTIVRKWDNIRNSISSKDVGLEEFIQLLDPGIETPVLQTSVSSIDYPAIQSGKVVVTDIDLSLSNRGFTEADLSFSTILSGVALSASKIAFNAAADATDTTVQLSIDSSQFLKGVNYSTSILINSSSGQQIEIPIEFKVIFPKNAFILQVAKYAVLFCIFFVFVRYLLTTLPYGLPSFLFVSGIALSVYFLIKYLSKNRLKNEANK